MKKTTGIFLLFLCIAMILAAGCTSQTASPPSPPAPTPTPASISTTAAITAAPTTAAITTIATTPPPVTLAATTDPIVHRWVKKYVNKVNGEVVGYEFKFYPEGTANYKYGTATMISDNIKIVPTYEASGTWTRLGNNTYLVKFLPTGVSGANIIREYTLVPAYVDPAYPGVTIPEHIESSYEKDSINKGQIKQADEMYYPERAKID